MRGHRNFPGVQKSDFLRRPLRCVAGKAAKWFPVLPEPPPQTWNSSNILHWQKSEFIKLCLMIYNNPIFKYMYTAHILTVPEVCHLGHFVKCIFASIASDFFIISESTQ